MARNGRSAQDASALFDGRRLTLARELAGLNKSQLAKEIEKSPASITGWELGSKKPAALNVAQLAIRLGVSPEFFITRGETSAREMSLPHFRSLRSTTQISRNQGKAYVRIVSDIVDTLEEFVEFPPSNIPFFEIDIEDSSSEVPEAAARELRKVWGLGDDPIHHLLRTAENNGIVVVFSPLQTSSIDAYSVEQAPHSLVILNPQKDDFYRQRFDLAHEIGHLMMHRDAEPGNKIVENQANMCAAEFLMPTERMRSVLPDKLNAAAWTRLKELKEEWGVSIQALLYRARFLGVLSETSYRNAMITLTKRGWRRTEPGARSILEQPSLLPKAVDLLRSEGFDELKLSQQCGAPLSAFSTATNRVPGM